MSAKAIQYSILQAIGSSGDSPIGIGTQLRAARTSLRLTLREVEERTTALAQESGNLAYRISGSWLDRVERENRCLSAIKLIVLALIYNLTPAQMLALCPGVGDSSGQLVSMPNLRTVEPRAQRAFGIDLTPWLPEKFLNSAPPGETMLLQTDSGAMPAHFRRAVIGLRDKTMEPMLPAGSVVFVDTQKRVIVGRQEWTNEFDRPLYLLFARDGYYCGFCSLDKKSEWLTLIPHMLSPDPQDRRWKFKRDVEVIGTVVAIFTRRNV